MPSIVTPSFPVTKQRVLVVDAEDDLLKLIGLIVEDEGLVCTRVRSEDGASAALDSDRFDLLIVDRDLTGSSVSRIAGHARKCQPDIPILLVTGISSDESVRESATLGVADYIVKPIDVMDLRKRLRNLIHPDSFRPLPHIVRKTRKLTLPPGAAKAFHDRHKGSDTRTTTPPPQWDNVDSFPKISNHPENEGPISVLLIYRDKAVRENLEEIITELGCCVTGFSTFAETQTHIRRNPFDVLVAEPGALHAALNWTDDEQRPIPLGAIAIMDQGGADKASEAIRIGAKGIFIPPFDRRKIAFEFRKTVERLIEERQEK